MSCQPHRVVSGQWKVYDVWYMCTHATPNARCHWKVYPLYTQQTTTVCTCYTNRAVHTKLVSQLVLLAQSTTCIQLQSIRTLWDKRTIVRTKHTHAIPNELASIWILTSCLSAAQGRLRTNTVVSQHTLKSYISSPSSTNPVNTRTHVWNRRTMLRTCM